MFLIVNYEKVIYSFGNGGGADDGRCAGVGSAGCIS